MIFFKNKKDKVVDVDPNEIREETYLYRIDTVGPLIRKIVTLVAVLWTSFQVYTSLFGLMQGIVQRAVTTGFAMILVFLCYNASKKSKGKVSVIDGILLLLSVTSIGYVLLNVEALSLRAGNPLIIDIILGTIFTIIVLEATRRSIGLPLVIVALVFIAYAFAGHYLPGLLMHKGYALDRLAPYMFLTTNGIFGTPLYVMSTYVFAFILFGSFLEATGGAKLFIELAYALTGKSIGGPAKTAVISSGLMGTINGSSLANVVSTGNFTIPLMKNVGYRPSFAAGVEAAASSGGQIMPPVMGAAAFIMAEFTGIPYAQICLAAAIPAILYFLSIYIMVHFEAKRLKLKPVPEDQLPNTKEALKKSWTLFVPLICILYMLTAGYSPLKAAMYSTILMIAVSYFNKHTRLKLKDYVNTFEKAALNSIAVTAACATCGIISGVVSLTGLGLKIADVIVHASGGQLWLTLIYTMIASIILGMGLPTTAKYIVLSTIAAPALLKLGVPLITAHMFIFYYGIIAEVTPPVALTSYAGAAIAKAPGVETALKGLRLSFAAFIIPYMFVYNPSLLMIDATFGNTIFTVVTSIVGIYALGASLGKFMLKSCSFLEQILLFAAAILLISSGHVIINTIGIVTVVAINLYQKRKLTKEEVLLKAA